MAGMAIRVPREITQGRMQIPVIEAGAIPRIQYSSGAARALEAFSRDMFSLANGFQDQLDATAEAEATSAGAVQGMTGDFELQSYGTIRGRAFNKAAVETFVTTVETQSIFKVQELQARFGTDPAQLERELKAWGEGVSGEIGKIYPPAQAAFQQRMALRSAPAVEAARDARYKLTREQADAALIENEIALKAEISTLSGDLFSDNPARSEAAAQAVGALQREYLQIFDAVDPTTNRPLYSAEERAKAKVEFYEDVMENAAIGWFDQQPDKAGAYVKFTEGDFTINLETPGADPARVIEVQAQVAGTRKRPLDKGTRDKIAVAAAATGDNIVFKVTSGGQAHKGSGGPRTGSTRHDLGHAGDGVLVVNGKEVLPDEDPALYERFFENAAAAGLTGIGHYAWGVHVGGGAPAAWGPSTTGADLNPRFGAAIARGRKGPKLDAAPTKATVDIRKALPVEAMNRIESEMRARINFRNTLADRQAAADEKALKTFQEATEFELANRVYHDGATDPETGNPVEPLTREELMTRVRRGMIEPAAGQRLIKALETEKPDKSDPAVFRDIERRLYAGENVTNVIHDNADKLSKEDASSLLGKNQTMNVAGEGGLSKEGAFYERQLIDLLTPDSLMAKIDEGAEDRKFLALGEYRRRVTDGELPEAVADDLRKRASLTFETITNSKLDTMVRPAFSVRKEGGLLDTHASAKALFKAFDEKKISATEFERQKRILKEWDDVQGLVVKQRKAEKPK